MRNFTRLPVIIDTDYGELEVHIHFWYTEDSIGVEEVLCGKCIDLYHLPIEWEQVVNDNWNPDEEENNDE